METGQTNIPVLIYRDKLGSWAGDSQLISLISGLTSSLGILHSELFKKTLVEYHRYRSVYDMEHNQPCLLMAKVIHLVDTCEWITDWEKYTKFEWRTKASHEIGWHWAYLYAYYNKIEFRNGVNLYPQLSIDFLLEVDKVLKEHAMPLLEDYHKFRDEADTVRLKLIYQYIIHAYSQWETNMSNTGAWANKVIDSILKLNYGDNTQLAQSHLTDYFKNHMSNVILVSNTTAKATWSTNFINRLYGIFKRHASRVS